MNLGFVFDSKVFQNVDSLYGLQRSSCSGWSPFRNLLSPVLPSLLLWSRPSLGLHSSSTDWATGLWDWRLSMGISAFILTPSSRMPPFYLHDLVKIKFEPIFTFYWGTWALKLTWRPNFGSRSRVKNHCFIGTPSCFNNTAVLIRNPLPRPLCSLVCGCSCCYGLMVTFIYSTVPPAPPFST